MSSGTQSNVYDVRQNLGGMIKPEFDGQGQPSNAPTMKLNPRQLELDWFWRFYRASEYEGRKVAWDGKAALPNQELDGIAFSGAIPPGFTDLGGQTFPLVARKPTAPSHTVQTVVDRFTSLIFGTKRQPRITSDDPKTEGWINAFAEATRLFSCFQQARSYGGGMGSVAVTFGFVAGIPRIDIHDARWCTPVFRDRAALELEALEKRYEWVDYIPDGDGGWIEEWYWYRRICDTSVDKVWPKVRVIAGVEPNWDAEDAITTAHNFGFVPGVWIQNRQVDDSIDGDPDCHGAFETVQAYDRMLAQADRAGIATCDPTPVVKSEQDFSEVSLGSGQAILLEPTGDAKFLEISGAGIDAALKLMDRFEKQITRITRCVIESSSSSHTRMGVQTATEVERNYSAMLDQADLLREQYGERALRKLLELVIRASRQLENPKIDAAGQKVQSKIKLPPATVTAPDGSQQFVEHQLGVGQHVGLVWPPYFAPSIDEATKVVDIASKALAAGIIDLETAVAYVSPHFGIENIPEMVKKLEAAAEKAKAQMAAGFGLAPGAASAPMGAQPAQPGMTGTRHPYGKRG